MTECVNSDIEDGKECIEEEGKDLQDREDLGLEPVIVANPCPTCGAETSRLGFENPDEFCPKREWFRCSNGHQWSIIVGPSQKPKEYENLGVWKRREGIGSKKTKRR